MDYIQKLCAFVEGTDLTIKILIGPGTTPMETATIWGTNRKCAGHCKSHCLLRAMLGDIQIHQFEDED